MLDVSNNRVKTLNRHLVEGEIIWAESVVRDDNVCVFLCWLDELFKRGLRLGLVCLEEGGELNLLVSWPGRVLENTPRESDVIVCVNEDAEVKHTAQVLVAEE